MAGRHWRAAPSVGAGIDSGIRARGAQGRPARRRRFLHHVRVFRARPLLQLCPAPRGAPAAASAGSAPSARPAIPRRSGGTHRRARPGRRAGAAFAQRQRAAPGGGDVADQHAARGLALAAVQPRAGDQQPRQRPLPARQRRVQRPPSAAASCAHAARPGRRRSGSARCPADNPALRASADDADRFRRRRDGRSAPGSPRRRGGTGYLAAARRASPSRAGRVRAARPAPHRRASAARSISA